MLQSAQLVEHAPERPDVALMVIGLLLAEFRGQIVRRSHHGVREVCCLVQHFRHAQVANLYAVILRQEHINCLDVSVQNFIGVQILNAQTHLNEELPNFCFRQGPPHLLLQINTQISIFAVLH